MKYKMSSHIELFITLVRTPISFENSFLQRKTDLPRVVNCT